MRAATGTVESLLAHVENMPGADEPGRPASFDLWVPDALTFRGQAVAQNLAMAMVLDAILAKQCSPDGFEPGENGRLYRYEAW